MKRLLLVMLFCLVCNSSIYSTDINSQPRRKSNIIFILADDLGLSDVACYGNPAYETSNLDQLVVCGIKFTNANATAPVYLDSRAAFLTGKSLARLHFEFVTKLGSKRMPIGMEQAKKKLNYTSKYARWCNRGHCIGSFLLSLSMDALYNITTGTVHCPYHFVITRHYMFGEAWLIPEGLIY